MRSIEFGYARHKRRDIPLIPVSLRSGGKFSFNRGGKNLAGWNLIAELVKSWVEKINCGPAPPDLPAP